MPFKSSSILSLLLVYVMFPMISAKHLSPIHKEGYCIWYGQCGSGGSGKPHNCFYNKPARYLNNTEGLDILRRLCPYLYKGNDTRTCCDTAQLKTLEGSLQNAQQLLDRCPSCWHNFLNLYCASTCSPDNSMFLNVTDMDNDDNGINKIEYYISDHFSQGFYNACKDVTFPGNNDKVLTLMCGTEASKCSAQKWLTYMGNVQNNLAPFQIDFKLGETNSSNITAMDQDIIQCNSSFFDRRTNTNASACSCQDCELSCPVAGPCPVPKSPKTIMYLELPFFILLILYIFFLVNFIAITVLMHHRKKPVYVYTAPTVYGSAERLPDLPGGHNRKPGFFIRTGDAFQNRIKEFFCWWGVWCSYHPFTVMLVCLIVLTSLGLGLLKFQVTTDPVKLWSAPTSQARLEKDMYDEKFAPFYRTEQLIITPKNQSWGGYRQYPFGHFIPFGPILKKELLHEILDLQLYLTNMNVTDNDGKTVTLNDICFKPLSPDNNNCTIISPLNYFQNSHKTLDHCLTDMDFPCSSGFGNQMADWHDHLMYCTRSPTSLNDTLKLGDPCMGEFGGPVNPNVALGGYPGVEYQNATAVIVTFIVNNHLNPKENAKALLWEKAYLEYLKNYRSDNLYISYSAERSIEDELDRESKTDIGTVVISYLLMFLYITFALGQYNWDSKLLLRFFIDSKFSLGFCGIFIVLCSVFCSLGLFSYAGFPATLIIIEVIPFLVLAVGVDNIFILVQAFQRDLPQPGEDIPHQLGRVLGDVAPSMLLSSLSESVAFAFGAMSNMPAVRMFSLYASVAVFFDFLFQVTCLVALMSLDAKRQRANRSDIVCCIKFSKAEDVIDNEGCLYKFMKNFYAPLILSKHVRPIVMCFFTFLLMLNIGFTTKIEKGLDQNISMPEDSYVLGYFGNLSTYLRTGPPVYFVISESYQYDNITAQNLLCGSAGCDSNSLAQSIFIASLKKNCTYIALPASSWIDDYLTWLQPIGETPCCRLLNYTTIDTCNMANITSPNTTVSNITLNCFNHTEPANGDQFCSATDNNPARHCSLCRPRSENGKRPTPHQFRRFLPGFLSDNPEIKCTKGGHASYGSAVKLGDNNTVEASYFMTYHTVLTESKDYIAALKSAREIAKNMSDTLGSHVYAYSVFYVFYEQYLTIVADAWQNLLYCTVSIFVVTFLLLGFNFGIALIVTITVSMIVLSLLGMMFYWNITLNAVSLVNLVMAVGISVEFCSHIARAFSVCNKSTRIERAEHSLANMGSSVLSGITLTKFGGIIVLGFAKSQIFKIFYFRMYLGMVIFGALHGLVFLPVFLSYVGPAPTIIKNVRKLGTNAGSILNSDTQPIMDSNTHA